MYIICFCYSILSFVFMEAKRVVLISLISFACGLFGGWFRICTIEINRKIWGIKIGDKKYLRHCMHHIFWSMAAVMCAMIYYFIFVGQPISILMIYVSTMLLSAHVRYITKRQ